MVNRAVLDEMSQKMDGAAWVSPYLQRRLRSVDEVLAERESDTASGAARDRDQLSTDQQDLPEAKTNTAA